MGDFWLFLSFFSFIRLFQLSAIAGPHIAGSDENRALFSFRKGGTLFVDYVTCWGEYSCFSGVAAYTTCVSEVVCVRYVMSSIRNCVRGTNSRCNMTEPVKCPYGGSYRPTVLPLTLNDAEIRVVSLFKQSG
jgi:hypothetical protein